MSFLDLVNGSVVVHGDDSETSRVNTPQAISVNTWRSRIRPSSSRVKKPPTKARRRSRRLQGFEPEYAGLEKSTFN
jgi:hypothetical protein